MNAVFRVDGGPNIGYGHLVRSGALAEEMLTRGHTVTVATSTPAPAQAIFPTAVEIVTLSSRDDPEPFVTWLEADAPEFVFADAHSVDTTYQCAVRDHVPIAVLQDDLQHTICADLFINGNVYASDLSYTFAGQPPKTCFGTDYVLLRREIRERAVEEPPWREQPARAIIMMGGGDIAELTPTVVRAFDGFDLRPEDLVARMVEADFAVSTASTTTYEHLALGTPMISIPVVDNQEPIATALRTRDIATVLEGEIRKETLRKAIQNYVTDAELRHRRREYGRKLVDGRGVDRVVAELRSIPTGEPTS